ncbi:MMPL family transporter [Luminiphilus sp.]|nr:MMPL family transporter [Luminiphilus sp.]MDB3899478.1 MMPL family transporter [Luminiphilus sp.]
MSSFYQRAISQYFGLIIVATAVVGGLAASQLDKVRLDASSDSLLLQGDPDLAFFQEATDRYESYEFLILTWEPDSPLLSDESLSGLASMVADLERVKGVRTVTSALDVPLLESPPISLTDLSDLDAIASLRDPKVDREMALKEFTTSQLYRNLVVSEAGDLTAVQVTIEPNQEVDRLGDLRGELRQQVAEGAGVEIQDRLVEVERAYDAATRTVNAERAELVANVRAVAEVYRGQSRIFVGGVPMIAADMLDFVQDDLVTFGLAIIGVMVGMLALIFRDYRWVVIPISGCTLSALMMLGLLGFTDWRMTIISSNFVAVLLVVSLALAIHLVVRYRELELKEPTLPRADRAVKAAQLMFVPCFYTAVTTMVAFTSLVVAGIKPVIDFGWMMTAGIVVAFIVSFTLVPALMALLPEVRATGASDQASMTRSFAVVVEKFGGLVFAVAAVLVLLIALGLSRLQVENRFIDYFKDTTEIYQGMELLDSRLGGTIPLDIILYPPEEIFDEEVSFGGSSLGAEAAESIDDDAFWSDDPFGEDVSFADENSAEIGYWFTLEGRNLIDQIHAIVDARPESGKVLSLSTGFSVMDRLYADKLGSVELALVERSLPDDVADVLIAPYYDPVEQQARLTVRAMETSKTLRRAQYLESLYAEILAETGLDETRVKFTGLLVLYNNVLQSLYASQILTLGAVFIAIGVMFLALFRSVSLALLGLAPNILAAGLVLGVMGLAGIPLDIMTITIAAIVVGMGVDNCIHYIHRFRTEFAVDQNYRDAMYRSHASIGRAMYYTTLTVVVGFSMLTLSNFTPSIYFGLLTVMAMLAAVMGALLLLPKLIITFKPLGPGAA